MAASEPGMVQRLEGQLRNRGRQSAAALVDALGISRPTLSRAVAAAPAVVRLGKARATEYALRQDIRGESQWPLYRMTAAGQIELLGTLIALDRGEFVLEAGAPNQVLLHPPFERGIYPDVPWFLEDLRPNGFLGRTYAHRVARELRVPADLKVWSAEHVISALLHGGSSQAGDLILGDLAMERALRELQSPPDLLPADERAQRYPALAAEVMRGEPPGSSPGGEQAKFTATLQDGSGRRALIVKFSAAEEGAAARRWATLLRCEAIAARVLDDHGVTAASTLLIEAGGQVFLESQRFDRTPTLGRRGFISLAAISTAFYGEASLPWWQLADLLERDGWLSEGDAVTLRRIAWFGVLIANTDMHLGNFGLFLADVLPLRIAPVYDMLPMQLRPSSQGSVVTRDYVVPVPTAGQHAHWLWAVPAALSFWAQVQSTAQIEPEVQRFAATAQREIEQMAGRFQAPGAG